MPVKKCLPEDPEKATEKLLKEKANRRKVLRNYFQKQRSDPFRHASGEGGGVFDAAILRYQSMKNSQFAYFKPNLTNALIGVAAMVLPMVGFGYLVHTSRAERECRLRSGKVTYKDRYPKFI